MVKVRSSDSLERLVRGHKQESIILVKTESQEVSKVGKNERQIAYDYFSLCEEMMELGDPQMALLFIEELEKLRDPNKRLRFSELDKKRRRSESNMESILEYCVSEILSRNNLQTKVDINLRYPFLVGIAVSKRDGLKVVESERLYGRVDVETAERIESEYKKMDLAAHVLPLGGLSGFPVLINGLGVLTRVIKSILHESGHNLLSFSPLTYFPSSPDIKAIEEITCDIVKDELGEIVLQEYFPDYAVSSLTEEKMKRKERFQRVVGESVPVVAKYLSAGDVAGAETYLEEVREREGLRVFNQATLSLYNSYSRAGNPIETKLRALRASSGGLYTFLRDVSQVTCMSDLENLLF